MRRNGTVVLLTLLTTIASTTAEAKRSRGDEIALMRARIVSMERDLQAMRRKFEAPPAAFFLASLAAYPPEGVGRIVPPLISLPPPTAPEQPANVLTAYRDHLTSLPGVSMRGAPVLLQDWMRKVAAACPGFKAISVCRPGARVAGSGRTSLHATCRAVDFQVKSPSCAWAVLNKPGARFPGGLSNDYRRVNHFHVSWAPKGREWAARFAHGGGRHYAKRYKARYAYASRRYRT